MKKLNIREAEITKKMYEEAKKIENLWNKTAKMDCRTEEFKKLNNKVIKLSDKFEEEVCDDFDTLEIVNEYERRMKKEKEENKQVEDKKMDKLEKKFIKKMVQKILEIEKEALQYTDYDFYNCYEVEDFSERTYGNIGYYINVMVDRGVNKNIINQLVDLNLALYDRNSRLDVRHGYNYKY